MKNTVATFQKMKESHEKISMLTCYDYSTARLMENAGINGILVGASLGTVMQGNEDTLLGGQRELREETGAVGRDYRFLGEIYPTPGYCAEIIWLYACRVDTIGDNAPDPDEFLDVARIPLDEAEQMVLRGEIPDAKTQIAVLKVAALHRNGQL